MIEPEFSRVVSTAHIDHGEIVQKIEADEIERVAIKARLKLEDISSLVAEFILRRSKHSQFYEVEGEAWANITQICVVSGEAFATDIKTTIRALYGDQAGLAIDHGYDSWDDIEQVEGGEIDIGELAVQHISLGLDPYPKKPGMNLGGEHHDEKPSSPFAVLKNLSKMFEE